MSKALTKILTALAALLFVLSAFMTGTNAWHAFDQHKTNVAIGGASYTQPTRPATEPTETTASPSTTKPTTVPQTTVPVTAVVPITSTATPVTTAAATMTEQPKSIAPSATKPTLTATITNRTTTIAANTGNPGEPPPTGNSFNGMIWFVLMIFSSFAMRYLLFGRKEKCTF